MLLFKQKTAQAGTRSLWYHLISLLTVSVWGLTFVSTKLLISAGLSPTDIFICRFLIAYVGLILLCHKRLFANSSRHEFIMILAGLCGGSIYFITENTALRLTYATNVSLLICTAPLFTMLISHCMLRTSLRISSIAGSCMALCGVALVVCNGTLNLGKSPLGDILTLIAALLWAIYCMLLNILNRHYNTLFITRKVFFYGLLSALLIQAATGHTSISISLLTKPLVALNLIFLGIVASFLCYIMWNCAVKHLGAEKTANYIYLTPLVTILAATAFLNEPFTAHIAIGSILIIGGMWIVEH